jgi:hypothetical protein
MIAPPANARPAISHGPEEPTPGWRTTALHPTGYRAADLILPSVNGGACAVADWRNCAIAHSIWDPARCLRDGHETRPAVRTKQPCAAAESEASV